MFFKGTHYLERSSDIRSSTALAFNFKSGCRLVLSALSLHRPQHYSPRHLGKIQKGMSRAT